MWVATFAGARVNQFGFEVDGDVCWGVSESDWLHVGGDVCWRVSESVWL